MRKQKYNKLQICSLYQDGFSISNIAEKLGCGKTTAGTIIKEAGLSRRLGESYGKLTIERRNNKYQPFSQDFIDYLDGLLISDGSLEAPYSLVKTSAYKQTSVTLGWLDDIQKEFIKNDLTNKISNHFRKDKNCYEHYIHSLRCYRLYLQYLRWYPNKIKIVPKDINLRSKIFLKNWIYGDGTLLNHNNLRFCTDSFLLSDIEWLIKKLNRFLPCNFKKLHLGKTINGQDKWRISLCLRDGLDNFYEYLGKPNYYFNYKWRSGV